MSVCRKINAFSENLYLINLPFICTFHSETIYIYPQFICTHISHSQYMNAM